MRVLLHICCGPCAVYSVQKLKELGHDVKGFFYNPNIHPVSEYKNRRQATESLSEETGLEIDFYRDYQFEDYFRKVTLHEDDRCAICWKLRLEETAEYASKNGFNGFTTTLLISPYQDHEKLKKIATDAGKKYSVAFVYEDFRPGFRESHRLSREMGLYHQKYCGCIYSERERFAKIHKV